MNIRFSIIVCTYNRAQLLDALLHSIVQAEKNPMWTWELVIIDNNSDDDTAAIIKTYQTKLPIKHAFEPQQGKSFALNHGLTLAQESLLMFLDDDVTIDSKWMLEFVAATFVNSNDCHWFGGRVVPDWSEPPAWLREETSAFFDGHFGDYNQGSQNRLYQEEDKLPLGASLALRKEIFERVGTFRTDLGPSGKMRGTGDETDLLVRAKEAGFKGYYIGQSEVRHHVGEDRLKLKGLLNYGAGKGLNQARMETDAKLRKGSIIRMASQLIRGLAQLIGGRGDRFRICLINIGIEVGKLRA